MPIDLTFTMDDFSGLQELETSELDSAIEVLKRDVATTFKNLVLGNTPVGIRKKKVGEERLKWTWSAISEISGGGIAFGTDAPYATVLESGEYPGVGPRTVQAEGGIYSRQAPGGVIGPLLEDEDVLNDITEEILESVKEAIANATAGNVY